MKLETFDAVVADYTRRFRDRSRQAQRWFAIQRSFESAIETAGMARSPKGKRLSHQRRIPEALLRAWTEALMARAAQLRRASTL